MSLQAFSASDDEVNLANQILVFSDCQESGALRSDAAINIFKRSGLSYAILRDIWNMVDENASGDLTIRELAAAIRLMGWVQVGEPLEESLLIKSGPLPTLDGVTDVIISRNVNSQTPRFPPINHDDILHFKRTFNASGPTVDGFLDGDIAMEIYMTSNLSYGELWKIRKLVDVTERGALDLREFAMGMYLIQAIQSCFITSIPSTIPPELDELFLDTSLLDLRSTSKRPPSSLRSKNSSLQSSPRRPQLLPSVFGSNIPLTPAHTPPKDDSWDISHIERIEAREIFQSLDPDRKGYIEGKTAANFMLTYKLTSTDLAHIWNLVDVKGDNRLTKDAFTVAMYLIKRKIAGDEIPKSLPPSLILPSMRSTDTPSSPTTPLSPKQLAKFKQPPPLPPKRELSRVKRPHTSSDPFPQLSPTTPPLPPNPKKSPNLQYRFSLSPPNHPEVVSPFEDPNNDTSTLRHHSPLPASNPLPPDHSNHEALEEFKKETSRLGLQVDSLLSQLTAQNTLRDANETLRNERDLLKVQLREMERTVSEVLSANEQNGSQEQYIQEIGRLTAELATKETENESTQRMLAVLTEEDKDLRRLLRESQTATAKAKSEVEDLREAVAIHERDMTELRARLSDMGKAMAEEPTSTSNNRELRVLFRDVTRENDNLKGQVRDMQQSMEQLLLSTKLHAKYDEVERENRRLKANIQELEMLATQSQSFPNNSSQRHENQTVAEATRENEQLKAQLQTGHRAFAELQSSSAATIDQLQQKLATMQHENNRLKIEVANSSGQRQEDNMPPPAYNDSFTIPS